MSRYWRIDAPLGHFYENCDDAHQVAVVLHYAFLACNVINSSAISNTIRCVEVYEHDVKCRTHGKATDVFLLIESTDTVVEVNIVSFLASQFLGRTMIPGVKDGIGKLRFSMISQTEYELAQAAYQNDLYSRNGNMVAHAA